MSVIKSLDFFLSYFSQIVSLHALVSVSFSMSSNSCLETTNWNKLAEKKELEILVDVELLDKKLNVVVTVRGLDLIVIVLDELALNLPYRMMVYSRLVLWNNCQLKVLAEVVLPEVHAVSQTVEYYNYWTQREEQNVFKSISCSHIWVLHFFNFL